MVITNENIIPIENKKVQIVEIREAENYQENWLTKKFLSKTYCCKNSLCGCSCSSYSCECSGASAGIGEGGFSFGRLAAHGRTRKEEIDIDPEGRIIEEVALKAVGAKEIRADGQVSGSLFGYRDSGGEVKVLSGTAGGEIGRNGIKGKLSADLYNIKSDGVQARFGVGVDTGVSVEDGLEVKAVGFGFSVSDKQVGFSTPLGEVKVDTDDCVIQ